MIKSRHEHATAKLESKSLMENLLSAGHIKHKYAVRLQTILLCANGKGTGEISEFLGINRSTVGLYINRYNEYGIDSLLRNKTRKPGIEPVSQKIKDEIYRLVCSEKPKDETQWSCRTLAKKVGIGKTTVHLILQEFGLQPHKVSRQNYSNDPDFEAKLKDVVGLDLNPPENAIVLCCR